MKRYNIHIKTKGVIVIKKAIMGLTMVLDFTNITQYFPFSHNYDWISFGGSFLGGIIGGLATFGGVYFSLKSQKEADDEKNRQAVIPVMEYKISYDKADFDNSSGQLNGEVIPHINVEGATYDGESEKWYFNLIAENIGLGSAQILSVYTGICAIRPYLLWSYSLFSASLNLIFGSCIR